MKNRFVVCLSFWLMLQWSGADVAYCADAPVATFAPVPADKVVEIKVTQAPAADVIPVPAPKWWEALLANNAVVSLLATGGGYVLLLVFKKHKEDAERWEGVIMHCFLDAENSGAIKKTSGEQKLSMAMTTFDGAFKDVFGKAPTAQDRADAKVDFARAAADADAGVPAPVGVKALLQSTQ